MSESLVALERLRRRCSGIRMDSNETLRSEERASYKRVRFDSKVVVFGS